MNFLLGELVKPEWAPGPTPRKLNAGGGAELKRNKDFCLLLFFFMYSVRISYGRGIRQPP